MKLLAALACLAAALAVAGPAVASTPDPQLLDTYQPVLVFHPNELFRPTKVQSFVGNSQLQRFVGTSSAQLALDAYWTTVDADPGPGSLPGPTAGVFYRLNETNCEADAALAAAACYAAVWSADPGGDAVYGRVVRTETRTVLQYWLFYYDNPLLLPTPFGTFWQSHEGDWELVNVILDADEQPVEAAYSQHCSGQREAWADVETSPEDSTHPVAYVALGSHANYFQPSAAPVPINPLCFPSAVPSSLPVDRVVDGRSVGAVAGPPGTGVEPATIHRIEGTAWSEFGGFWGESEYFFTPIAIGPFPANTAIPVGPAPSSPANQAKWNPEVVLAWPPA